MKYFWILTIGFLYSCTLFGEDAPLPLGSIFLALGDSYTIGQGVSSEERWPAQFIDQYGDDYGLEDVEYRAITGWTTGALLASLDREEPSGSFGLVSLLIGVNNQFTGQDFSVYRREVPDLVDLALGYVGERTDQVVILSIPDYAYTPFGLSRGSVEQERISEELDAYNDWMSAYARQRGIRFINITPITRRGLVEPELVAQDGLHPSGLAYLEFAGLLEEALKRD